MSKRRGFTLTEVLVVVAITTVVLGMVGGLLVFMTNSSRELIVKSEEIMLVQSIENHLRGYLGDDKKLDAAEMLELDKIDLYENNIVHSERPKPLFENTGISFFHITHSTNTSDQFIECIIRFDNEEYRFIIDVNPNYTTTP